MHHSIVTPPPVGVDRFWKYRPAEVSGDTDSEQLTGGSFLTRERDFIGKRTLPEQLRLGRLLLWKKNLCKSGFAEGDFRIAFMNCARGSAWAFKVKRRSFPSRLAILAKFTFEPTPVRFAEGEVWGSAPWHRGSASCGVLTPNAHKRMNFHEVLFHWTMFEGYMSFLEQ